MSDRGTDLMSRARAQLDEATRLVGGLSGADLRRPCPEVGGDGGEHSVGAVAGHLADGYTRLVRLLPDARDHGSAQHAEAVTGLVDRLTAGVAALGLLAELTDERLDSVPEARSGPFFDGRRSLAQVLDAVVSHQEEHLAALRRAVS